MATAYDCKFIETSVGINHNVDELLVGLLSQIRLKLENPEKSRFVVCRCVDFRRVQHWIFCSGFSIVPMLMRSRDLFRKRSCRKTKRRSCSPLNTACLSGNGTTNPSTPVSMGPNIVDENNCVTPPTSAQNRYKNNAKHTKRKKKKKKTSIKIPYISVRQSEKTSRHPNIGQSESERTAGTCLGTWLKIKKLWKSSCFVNSTERQFVVDYCWLVPSIFHPVLCPPFIRYRHEILIINYPCYKMYI